MSSSLLFFICSIDKKDTMMVKDDNNSIILFFFLLFFFHALTNNNSYDDVFFLFLFGRGTRRLIVVCVIIVVGSSPRYILNRVSCTHTRYLQQTYIQIDQKPKILLHIKARDGNASTTKRNIVASIQDAENSCNILSTNQSTPATTVASTYQSSATFNWLKDCWYTKTSTKSNETSQN